MTGRPHRAGNDDILKPLVNLLAELAERLKGILAPMHGCCPRVVLFPVKRDCAIPNAHDVGYHANFFSCLVQPRTLFNVAFNETAKDVWIKKFFRTVWHSIARIQECHALCIGQIVSLLQWQCACPNCAACCNAKSSFFVLKTDDRNRGTARLHRGARQFQTAHNPQGPIQPATFGLCICMGSNQDGFSLGQTKCVPNRIHVGR